MKTVFFGASAYVLPIAEVLNKNFELELVVTTEKESSEPVIKFCIKNKIPYLSVSNKNELLTIKGQLGIVADFGVIIPKTVLDSFTYGILNIHPSLLPKYRGPTPVQTALLNGDKKTGVTIIKLDELMDHGPILTSEKVGIKENDTSETLLNDLFKKGAEILPTTISNYQAKQLKASEQEHDKATSTKMLKREDGFIDLKKTKDFEKLQNMIRAFYPWPGVWTKAVLSENGDEKIIKFLPKKLIQVEGKKEVSYKDFLNGYPKANSHLRLFLEKN